MNKPSVFIVILNWNGKEDTLACLSSVFLIDYSNFNVVVVDNGSVDGSVESFVAEYPDLKIIQTGDNLGYAGGNNCGIKYALENNAEYILLLNNDTVVAPDFLTHLFESSLNFPHGYILGPKIYYYDHPEKIWFAGGKWNSNTLKTEHIGMGQINSQQFEQVIEVDYITGCALFASSSTFKEVGMLDDAFFLTFEETDWCYRAKAKGYHCIFIPKSIVWHKVSVSFGGASSPLANYFMTRNKLLWIEKNLPYVFIVKACVESISNIINIVLPVFDFKSNNQPYLKTIYWGLASWAASVSKNIHNPENISYVIGVRDYFLRKFGNCPDAVRNLRK